MPQQRVMYDAAGNEIATPASTQTTQTATPSLGTRLVDQAVNTLPSIGGVVGGVLGGAATAPETLGVGTPAGVIGGAAVGGAGGTAAKNIINILRGKDVDPSMRAALIEQMTNAGIQGLSAALPIGIKLRAPGARDTARSMWTNAAKNTSATAPQDAEAVLSRGMGRPVASNTSALAREADAGVTPGQPERIISPAVPERTIPGRPAVKMPAIPERVVTPAQPDVTINEIPTSTLGPGQPRMVIRGRPADIQPGRPEMTVLPKPAVTIPGQPAVVQAATPDIPSPLATAVSAHRAYTEATNPTGVNALGKLGIVNQFKGLLPSGGTVAQGVYNAANNAGPIGELLRQALMSYLSGQNK